MSKEKCRVGNHDICISPLCPLYPNKDIEAEQSKSCGKCKMLGDSAPCDECYDKSNPDKFLSVGIFQQSI